MTNLSARAFDIVDLHNVASCATSHHICLWSRLIDVINDHSITNELRRSGRAHFHLRQIVDGVEWVITLTRRLELNNLRGSSLNVISPQVCLILVEADMEGARTRPVNVPVGVDILSFVNFLRSVKFGNGAYSITMSVIVFVLHLEII